MINLSDLSKPLPDIAFFGKMRAGKDETFKVIQEMGYNVNRSAFGDVMKERFFETFPWIPQEPKPIALLQQYGQAMREIDPDVWVRPTMARIKVKEDILAQHGLDIPSFIFTDVRQPNELQACIDAGCVIVYIHAHENVRVDRMLRAGETVSTAILNAPTEQHIDDWLAEEKADYVISNNGFEADLKRNVMELIYQIQSHRQRS
jgi:hypothetical protein